MVAETASHPTPTAEAWWALVMGSGYRGTIDRLAPDARDRVKRVNLDRFDAMGIRAVEANVVYAVAAKDAAQS